MSAPVQITNPCFETKELVLGLYNCHNLRDPPRDNSFIISVPYRDPDRDDHHH